MPQTVRKERKVRTLKSGDKVVVINAVGDVLIVETADHKVKWSTVVYTDGSKVRVEGDEMVIVESEEPTAEERAEERKEARIWGIERSITQAADSLAEAREKMIAEIDSPYTSHWAYEAFIAAKEADILWRRVAHVWELAQQPEHKDRAIEQGEKPFETIIDAYDYVKRDVMKKVLEYFDPTSRSTSTVSNVIEDVQRGVQLKFARDDRWY